jgi:hypothetical protein
MGKSSHLTFDASGWQVYSGEWGWSGWQIFFLRTLVFRAFSDKPDSVPESGWVICPKCLVELAMRIPEHPTLIRQMLDSRLGALGLDTPVLAASLSQITKHCGRKACHCKQGGPLHTAWHLTFKVEGKTRTVYVPLDLLDEVQSWIAEHKRIKALLHEIHTLTVALVRTHAQHTKRKQGRP